MIGGDTVVNRHQVSLIITNDHTSSVVESLKKDKRLKSLLVNFLDKYAENPQQVELWLNNEDAQSGVVEESEKLVKLKSSLELFKAFLDTAKAQNESNVDSYTDYLTNEEYYKFRTEFEKSEQRFRELDAPKDAPTMVENKETENLKNEVKELKDDLNELKHMLSEALTKNSLNIPDSKISVTSDLHEELQADNESVNKSEEIIASTEIPDADQLIYEEEEIIEKETSLEEVASTKESDSSSDPVDDISDALDILADLDL